MIGAIIGDMVGAPFEFNNNKSYKFPLFNRRSQATDDTVCTCGVAWAIMYDYDFPPYAKGLRYTGKQYPDVGWGARFREWVMSPKEQLPYDSWGNGSAMRVSPVAWAFNNLEDVLLQARKSAEVTHNHPEGIKGAQATAHAIWMARQKTSKERMRQEICNRYYPLAKTLDEIRPTYKFDVSCQGSVPVAIIAFLESNDFEDCLRKAVSVGGDSDTIAAIAGSIAHAYYGAPWAIVSRMWAIVPYILGVIVREFCMSFDVPGWDG